MPYAEAIGYICNPLQAFAPTFASIGRCEIFVSETENLQNMVKTNALVPLLNQEFRVVF
jgi:hypothetical protein